MDTPATPRSSITPDTTLAELDSMLRGRRAFLRIRLARPDVVTSYDAAKAEDLDGPGLHYVLQALFDRPTADTEPDPVRLAVERLRAEGVVPS